MGDREERRPRPTEPAARPWARSEEAAIRQNLDRRLGPELTSVRSGPGGVPVRYMDAVNVLKLANEVFGFNGWNSRVMEFVTDYLHTDNSGRVSCCISAIVRITLRDGTYREDVGHGIIENSRSVAQTIQKCKKEAVTDAIKRSLRQFGNALGLCLYDKEYLHHIRNVQAAKSAFNAKELIRAGERMERHIAKHTAPEPTATTDGEVKTEAMRVQVAADRAAAPSAHNETEIPDFFDDDFEADMMDEPAVEMAPDELSANRSVQISEGAGLAAPLAQQQQQQRPGGVALQGEDARPTFANTDPEGPPTFLMASGQEPFVPSDSIVKTPGVDRRRSTPVKRPGHPGAGSPATPFASGGPRGRPMLRNIINQQPKRGPGENARETSKRIKPE